MPSANLWKQPSLSRCILAAAESQTSAIHVKLSYSLTDGAKLLQQNLVCKTSLFYIRYTELYVAKNVVEEQSQTQTTKWTVHDTCTSAAAATSGMQFLWSVTRQQQQQQLRICNPAKCCCRMCVLQGTVTTCTNKPSSAATWSSPTDRLTGELGRDVIAAVNQLVVSREWPLTSGTFGINASVSEKRMHAYRRTVDRIDWTWSVLWWRRNCSLQTCVAMLPGFCQHTIQSIPR